MEFLIPLVAFVLLGFAASRWGHDSTDALRSAEDDLAHHGVAWSGKPRAS